MSDDGGIKAGIGQIAQDVGEAVAEPVKDQVGEAIEQAAQTVIPGPKQVPPDPQATISFQQEQSKKQAENQKKMQWAQATIARYQKIDEEQAAVRMKKKQEEQSRLQEEHQEKQVKQFELQKQEQKSADLTAVQREARKTEIKGGVGG